jgi:hypothetical protein
VPTNRLFRNTELRTFSGVKSWIAMPFRTDVLWKATTPEGLECILKGSFTGL